MDTNDENIKVKENEDGTIEVELSEEYYEVIKHHMKENNFESISDTIVDLLKEYLNERS